MTKLSNANDAQRTVIVEDPLCAKCGVDYRAGPEGDRWPAWNHCWQCGADPVVEVQPPTEGDY